MQEMYADFGENIYRETISWEKFMTMNITTEVNIRCSKKWLPKSKNNYLMLNSRPILPVRPIFSLSYQNRFICRCIV